MNCTVTKNILPFLIFIGSKYTRPNTKTLPKKLLKYIDILNIIISKINNNNKDLNYEINKLPVEFQSYFTMFKGV